MHPACGSAPPHGFGAGAMPPGAPGGPGAAPMGMVFRPGGPPGPGYGGQQQMPTPPKQLQSEVMLLQGDERIRSHREALKHRLAMGNGLSLEELEDAVRMMILSGRFAGSQGIPEIHLAAGFDRYLQPPSPFRTMAELAACIPWLLRVHQSMQWVTQGGTGLLTVYRLICPAASETGWLPAEGGVLAVDWRMVEEVMARPEENMARPGMDPRYLPRPGGYTGPGPNAGAPSTEGAVEMSQPPASAPAQPAQPPPPAAPPPRQSKAAPPAAA